MALKITSGGWLSASDENRAQRDALRQAFFAQAGIAPARSLRDVNIGPERRTGQAMALVASAATNRIGDANLDAITAITQAEMLATGLGMHPLVRRPESSSLGIVALAPEVLQRFFVTDHHSAFDRSLF